MSGWTPDAVLDRLIGGELPANVALMQLLVEARDAADAEAMIRDRLATCTTELGRERLAGALGLARLHPDAGRTVRAVLAEADHDATSPEEWAAVFDRLAATSPEPSVALYALGSPDLLRAATAEVVERCREWGLLGRDRRLLEIGCGIGRLTLALAPEMADAVGLDISAGMVAEARRRGAGCLNASFRQTGGRDLADLPADSRDVVLAADVFPYLTGTDPEAAERLIGECARVLRPGGALLILNYSYRGDPDRDRAEIQAAFSRSGLTLARAGTRDLTLWDAVSFLGSKRDGDSLHSA